MNRRAFIAGLAGAAAYPLAVRAQHSAMPVVGFLRSETPEGFEPRLAAFRAGLQEAGYVEDRNVVIELHWGQSRDDTVSAIAAELVRRQVAVIVVSGSPAIARAAQAATATIPVVFAIGGDPVLLGLVASLNRPAGNVTGVSFVNNALTAKRLELLREFVPAAATVAVLVNPRSLNTEPDMKSMEAAAAALRVRLHRFNAGTVDEIDRAFAALAELRPGALLIAGEPFFTTRRKQLVALAARYAIATSYSNRDYVVDGGLMSYGASIIDAHRQMGVYAGRILKGEKAANLPVLQPTKFEFTINRKTATSLGLEVPSKFLFTADEVIE